MLSSPALNCADVLREGGRLRGHALSQLVDVNASYLLVHNVFLRAFRIGVSAMSAAALDTSLCSEVALYFDRGLITRPVTP